MKDKLKKEQIEQLLKVQEQQEEVKEIEKQIRDLEAELDWAESQRSNDYKYIVGIEKKLDELYEQYNKSLPF